jgi:hypothetical protein
MICNNPFNPFLRPGGEAYAYYTAWCDYTGFDCQGDMILTVSRDPVALICKGITPDIRNIFLREKRDEKQIPRAKWYEVVQPPKTPRALSPITTQLSSNPVVSETARALSPVVSATVPRSLSPSNLSRPTNGFIHVYRDGKEIKCQLDVMHGLMMEELEICLKRLTKTNGKVYDVSIITSTIHNIDEAFVRRFGNPEKRWRVKMQAPFRFCSCTNSGGWWGESKVEVRFVLRGKEGEGINGFNGLL